MATRKTPATKTTKPATPKASGAPSTEAKALHRKALRHNWDGGTWKLHKILDDAACDYGTALMIYWLGSPGYYQQYAKLSDAEDYEREVFGFLRELEKRLLKRDFATSDILFNPRWDRTTINPAGHDWTASNPPKIVRPIPAKLLAPSNPDPDAR